ncbi:MAG TPA: Fic/DOC family N-terminal domain-containing protein [Xanthomonadaceae bacterium]|jgi:Fic family protein
MAAPVRYHIGKFPPNLDWARLVSLIGKASEAVGRYDGVVSAIPNAEVLLSPLFTQEAVLSSRIEGTVATIGEVLEVEGGDASAMNPRRREDAYEIINYRKAVRFCEAELRDRPISQHMLRQAHSILMAGVRGRNKDPGSYRKQQNWIGAPKCKIEEASFIPIDQSHLQAGLDAWDAFMTSDPVNPLVQLAVLHAEFEALHPFLDGNGRLGRMIIPLYMHAQGALRSGPHFYVSAFLDAHRDEYLDRLRAVSADDDWTGWVLFFLEALRFQAQENEAKATEILSLYAEVKERVVKFTHSQHAIQAVDFIFSRPVFFGPTFITDSRIPRASATRILTLMRTHNLLRTLRAGLGRRPGLYEFSALLEITERDTQT